MLIFPKNLGKFFFGPYKFFWVLANSSYLRCKRISKNLKEFLWGKKESTKVLKVPSFKTTKVKILTRDNLMVCWCMRCCCCELLLAAIKDLRFRVFREEFLCDDEENSGSSTTTLTSSDNGSGLIIVTVEWFIRF